VPFFLQNEEARKFLAQGNCLLIEKDPKITNQFGDFSSPIWEGDDSVTQPFYY